MASIDWANTTARRDKKHLSFEICCVLYERFDGSSDKNLCFPCRVGLAKVIAELLHGRVNLEAQDSLNGNTALHYAVQKQRGMW